MEPEKKIDLQRFKEKFIEEATDLLGGLDGLLMNLENEPNNKDAINNIFRALHTIKGSSGTFGFNAITEITHDLENIFDAIRNGDKQINESILNLTFSVADHIRNLLTDEELKNADNIENQKILLEGIKGCKECKQGAKTEANSIKLEASKEGLKTYQIIFNPDETIIKRAINLSITFHDLFTLGKYHIHAPAKNSKSTNWAIFLITEATISDIEDALLFVMDYCKITKVADFDIFKEENLNEREKLIEEIDKARDSVEVAQDIETSISTFTTKTINTTDSKVKHIKKIYVESIKLDHLMYLVSELVTAKSELLLSINENPLKTLEAAEKIDKLSKLFSDSALNIRLVSLNDMILRFQRLIRDLSKQLNKKIDFVTVGNETELDKNIIDAIAEPIMHLLRNCMDHGIERPENRVAKGKSDTGTIKLTAYKNGNNVHIEISDDGNGINTDYVYQKAVDKGFIQAGTHLSKKELLELIFLPGLSTANSLTEVSGRGVGMDVVLKKINEIRGEVSIESEPQQGTTFKIKLQQTISIIETLLVISGDSKYAIPIDEVEICALEKHQNIVDRQSNLLDFKENLIPYISLREHFHPTHEAMETEKIIVINRNNVRYAIIADKIIGEFQAVVKPLGGYFEQQRFLSGAGVYGDGSVVLLLDTERLKELIITSKQ